MGHLKPLWAILFLVCLLLAGCKVSLPAHGCGCGVTSHRIAAAPIPQTREPPLVDPMSVESFRSHVVKSETRIR